MITLCVLSAIFATLAGLLALFIRCLRNVDPKLYAEALREELGDENGEEDEHTLKEGRNHTFNVDGSLMTNSMVDIHGKPYGHF
jgi:hypothetical protein